MASPAPFVGLVDSQEFYQPLSGRLLQGKVTSAREGNADTQMLASYNSPWATRCIIYFYDRTLLTKPGLGKLAATGCRPSSGGEITGGGTAVSLYSTSQPESTGCQPQFGSACDATGPARICIAPF